MNNITILNNEIKDKVALEQRAIAIFNKVAKFFPLKDLPKISIFLHTSRSDYDKSIGRITQVWEVGNTGSSGKINIIHPDYFEKISSHKNSEFDQILAHEIAHIFIGEIADGRAIPMWLNEGLSMNIAGQLDRYKNHGPMYIEENFSRNLATQKGWDDRSNYDAYKVSCLFVAFLISRFSIDKVQELIKNVSKNYYAPDFDKSVIKVFGKSIDKLESEFIMWAEKNI